MQSNNERGGPEPSQSRSRVSASPTGRALHGEPQQRASFLFKPLVLRPAQGKFLTQRPALISLEMDFASIERRIIAANPQAAEYLKRKP